MSIATAALPCLLALGDCRDERITRECQTDDMRDLVGPALKLCPRCGQSCPLWVSPESRTTLRYTCTSGPIFSLGFRGCVEVKKRGYVAALSHRITTAPRIWCMSRCRHRARSFMSFFTRNHHLSLGRCPETAEIPRCPHNEISKCNETQ